MKKKYIRPSILVRNVSLKNCMLDVSNSRSISDTSVNGARNTTEMFEGGGGDIDLSHEIGVSNKADGDDIWGGL